MNREEHSESDKELDGNTEDSDVDEVYQQQISSVQGTIYEHPTLPMTSVFDCVYRYSEEYFAPRRFNVFQVDREEVKRRVPGAFLGTRRKAEITFQERGPKGGLRQRTRRLERSFLRLREKGDKMLRTQIDFVVRSVIQEVTGAQQARLTELGREARYDSGFS